MGRKALPAGERRKQYTVQLTEAEAEGIAAKYGSVNGAMRLLVEGGVVPVPKPVSTTGVVQREPPSGSKCKSPWKCGRGLAACLPCQEAENGRGSK